MAAWSDEKIAVSALAPCLSACRGTTAIRPPEGLPLAVLMPHTGS